MIHFFLFFRNIEAKSIKRTSPPRKNDDEDSIRPKLKMIDIVTDIEMGGQPMIHSGTEMYSVSLSQCGE